MTGYNRKVYTRLPFLCMNILFRIIANIYITLMNSQYLLWVHVLSHQNPASSQLIQPPVKEDVPKILALGKRLEDLYTSSSFKPPGAFVPEQRHSPLRSTGKWSGVGQCFQKYGAHTTDYARNDLGGLCLDNIWPCMTSFLSLCKNSFIEA